MILSQVHCTPTSQLISLRSQSYPSTSALKVEVFQKIKRGKLRLYLITHHARREDIRKSESVWTVNFDALAALSLRKGCDNHWTGGWIVPRVLWKREYSFAFARNRTHVHRLCNPCTKFTWLFLKGFPTSILYTVFSFCIQATWFQPP
jgi:hypothetical protein